MCHTSVCQFCPICVQNRRFYGISVLANAEKAFPGKNERVTHTPAHPYCNFSMLWVRANPRSLFTIKYPHVEWEKWSQMCCILSIKKLGYCGKFKFKVWVTRSFSGKAFYSTKISINPVFPYKWHWNDQMKVGTLSGGPLSAILKVWVQSDKCKCPNGHSITYGQLWGILYLSTL